MRLISKKTKYGLRALYALTRNFGNGYTLVSRLAEDEAIPKKFLDIILLVMKNSGLVESKPGRGGGYYLAKPPDQITVGAVVRLMEGPLAPLPCASETAYRPCEECVDVSTCETRLVMREVRDATAAILDRRTLADVCLRTEKLRAANQKLLKRIAAPSKISSR